MSECQDLLQDMRTATNDQHLAHRQTSSAALEEEQAGAPWVKCERAIEKQFEEIPGSARIVWPMVTNLTPDTKAS